MFRIHDVKVSIIVFEMYNEKKINQKRHVQGNFINV